MIREEGTRLHRIQRERERKAFFHRNFPDFKIDFCSMWPDGYITFQSLAMYNNDNLPFSRPKPSKKYPKTFKILPKWRNFAKSGHTASNPPQRKRWQRISSSWFVGSFGRTYGWFAIISNLNLATNALDSPQGETRDLFFPQRRRWWRRCRWRRDSDVDGDGEDNEGDGDQCDQIAKLL